MTDMSVPQKSFCLIRHGETTANLDGVIAGRTEVALTVTGRAQARALGHIAWPDRMSVFCSPQDRARETCALGFPGRAVSVQPDLRERDWGVFEGRLISEAPPRDHHPEGGESWEGMILRVASALRVCCALAGENLPVLVCHSGVIRAARLLTGQKGPGRRPENAQPKYFICSKAGFEETTYDPT